MDGDIRYRIFYDQTMRGSISIFSRDTNEDVYDPLIENFIYKLNIPNIDNFINHYNQRIDIGKPFIYYKHLNKIEHPRKDLVSKLKIENKDIHFHVSGSLYNIFSIMMIIHESECVSRFNPKFKNSDVAITNFGNAMIEDYSYDPTSNSIDYICSFQGINYAEKLDFRSIPGEFLKHDRNFKIDSIIKK